ncbi:hypothetical protein [Natronococcus jeotgali]|uniref:hypothetical protein n=1 Tax=Natronococcus jeotgali TaxID=413812 RepID=UPI001267C376|nr:hypothetical protein [Natronococcus jeotgali]
MSDRKTFKRRTVLKSIGVSGAATAGLSQTGAASENSNISITDLTGGHKKESSVTQIRTANLEK